LHAVGNAIAAPTRIEESYNRSYIFIDEGTTNASGDPLVVPVKVVEGTSARVKSFFFGSNDPNAVVLWRKS
jgi:hypothetical protein